jgi:hypothetical protein
MATTTNYGWTTPDDTALVKDGASAIRTLGSSVDTSVKALNPGTTSGDLDYYTAATTKARIAKGTAGQVFTMNSGATAPEWQTLNAGGMTLISTTTLTGASITLSSIPATYNNLQLVVQNYRPANDGVGLFLRLNNNSGTVYAASTITDDGTGLAPNLTSVQIGGDGDNTVVSNLSIFDIFNYTNGTTWKVSRALAVGVDPTTNTSASRVNTSYLFYDTTAISSIVLFPSSGNFTSGTALLYGVK